MVKTKYAITLRNTEYPYEYWDTVAELTNEECDKLFALGERLVAEGYIDDPIIQEIEILFKGFPELETAILKFIGDPKPFTGE